MLPSKIENELNELIADCNRLLDATIEDLNSPLSKENLESDKIFLLKYKLGAYPFFDEKPTNNFIEHCKRMDETNKRYGYESYTDPYWLSVEMANEINDHIQKKLTPLHRRFDDVLRLIDSVTPSEVVALYSKQLITNLTDSQRGLLFDLMVKAGFIPNNTEKNGFIWAFGGNVEGCFESHIEWKKTKNLLSHFVDVFNCEILGNDGRVKRTQWKPFELLFGQSGLRGAKNDYQKTGSIPEGSKQVEAIIKEVLNYK